MFEIHPNAIYSKSDLATGLKGVVDVDRLLERIRPKAVVMGVFLGKDLLAAFDRAGDYRDGKIQAAKRKEGKARTRTRKPVQGRRKERPGPSLISIEEMAD